MTQISVIIPFFQRQPGILRRALAGVLAQRVAQNITVQVIVVDDGSPVSAQSEAKGLEFKPPFQLTIFSQQNGGVAVARNTGLKAVPANTTYIAFLDSDDIWHEGHLQQAVDALEQGYDFYFCDNRREGHHESCFASGTALMLPFIEHAADKDAVIPIGKDELYTVILRNFPCQISTTLYRRSINPALLFETHMKNAGEDVIFLLNVVAGARRIGFSAKVMVDCGGGVNLYFSNLGWNSAGHLTQTIDRYKGLMIIRRTIRFTHDNAAWNKAFTATFRRKIAFHSLRHFVHAKGKWPTETKALAREDKWFYLWFPFYTVQVSIGWALGLYHPF